MCRTAGPGLLSLGFCPATASLGGSTYSSPIFQLTPPHRSRWQPPERLRLIKKAMVASGIWVATQSGKAAALTDLVLIAAKTTARRLKYLSDPPCATLTCLEITNPILPEIAVSSGRMSFTKRVAFCVSVPVVEPNPKRQQVPCSGTTLRHAEASQEWDWYPPMASGYGRECSRPFSSHAVDRFTCPSHSPAGFCW